MADENGSSTTNSYPSVITYDNISIEYLLGSVEEVVNLLGDSALNDEYKLRYDNMEFYHENGMITSFECLNPNLLKSDDIALNKNREGLIEIFGEPSDEGESGGGYTMNYFLPSCSISFELGEPNSEAWRVYISPAKIEENKTIPSNYEDAYNIAQTWITAHPESSITISDYPDYTYKHQGEDVEYYLFYLGDEMYYANLLVNSETGALSMLINYDGEHPWSEITLIDDYYNEYWSTSQSNTTSDIIFQGIPVHQYFDNTIDEVIEILGSPLSYEEYDGGRYCYDGIIFICDDFTGEILKIELEPSACEVDGITLDKPESRLKGILGAPTDEDFIRDVQGGTNDVVGYYMQYTRVDYSFTCSMASPDVLPYSITVLPN